MARRPKEKKRINWRAGRKEKIFGVCGAMSNMGM